MSQTTFLCSTALSFSSRLQSGGDLVLNVIRHLDRAVNVFNLNSKYGHSRNSVFGDEFILLWFLYMKKEMNNVWKSRISFISQIMQSLVMKLRKTRVGTQILQGVFITGPWFDGVKVRPGCRKPLNNPSVPSRPPWFKVVLQDFSDLFHQSRAGWPTGAAMFIGKMSLYGRNTSASESRLWTVAEGFPR